APDSQQESSPLSGRKSTQATVRICGASSVNPAAKVSAQDFGLIDMGRKLPGPFFGMLKQERAI
ncbi:hypothetical protein, partial [Bradyrhizobium liaoningense]|uniref:hypothetical protein n=1 Tax=Bradyrhizobium liaoningense TaxID=43992 RepID=UPI001BABDF95